jgi:hypothetical protein
MSNLTTLAGAAAVLAATALGMAGPAYAASAGPSAVEQIISQLQSDGYNVIIDKVGAKP